MPRRRGRGKPFNGPPVVPYKPPTEPYHPNMKSYSNRNIDAFIESCQEWDDFKEKVYDLPSGEFVCIQTYTKYFDKDKKHYIRLEKTWAENILVGVFHSLCDTKTYSCGHGKSSTHPRAAQLAKKVRVYKNEERVIGEMQPNLDKFCSPDFHFDSVKSDPLFTVTVTDNVSFGDFKECQETQFGKMIISATGTVHNNWGPVRPFLPGVYKVTVVKMFEKTSEPTAIYHHERVDPIQIAKRIILHINDLSFFHDIPNSINRYEWCEWKNYGGFEEENDDEDKDESSVEEEINISELNLPEYFDHREGSCAITRSAAFKTEDDSSVDSSEKHDSRDENSNIKAKYPEFQYLTEHRETIYFVPTENALIVGSSIKNGKVLKSDNIPELYQILGDKDEAIAIGVDIGAHKFGDWVFGEVFQDQATNLNFALVAHGCGPDDMFWVGKMPKRLIDRYPGYDFVNVQDTHFRFNVSEFFLG